MTSGTNRAATARSLSLGLAIATLLAACTAVETTSTATPGAGAVSQATANTPAAPTADRATQAAKFQQDRAAILAMAGDHRVSFDFRETVPFAENYELKSKVSGGYEVVRVIEDRGDFISLQHILVVGGEEGMPVKHWRQDWRYQPEQVLVFVGGNAWAWREVAEADRRGAWSQTVYQVDDAPRYGAVGRWDHDAGVSEWTPPAEWRPLPRRDATTRDDYHAINAVNRHALLPNGWVHEQDNSKLILTDGEPEILVREVGVNTYLRTDEFDVSVATTYWAKTEAFWAGVRAKWTAIERSNDAFGLTIQGEPEELYFQILGLAEEVRSGEKATPVAIDEAKAIIDSYTVSDIGTLSTRLGG